MDSTLILTVIAGAAMAGFVQGLSGFGYGLTAMSIWAWTLEPMLAAALAVFGGLTGQLISAVSVRRGFDWKLVAPFIAGGLAGLPLGLWLLPRLDVMLFKLVLGLLLVVFCPLMLLATRLPKVQRGGRVGDALAGAAGGVMGGLGGFTGVVPTLWCQVRGLSKDHQRSVIQNFNLTMLAVTFATYVATGIICSDMLPLFAIAAPAMLVPSLLGARLYIGISENTFRKVVLGVLTAAGVAMLVSAVPALLARA
ncbi:MAG: sulfite exporter TauE/SafE family protein [Ramlibacter sp.]|nr:sulfite exporter TauE/SafE family protein [Ramlibacter sp.]